MSDSQTHNAAIPSHEANQARLGNEPFASSSPEGRGETSGDAEIEELLKFKPVSRRFKREDGWTAALQRKFIARLAVHGSPGKACEELGKHRSGLDKVYKSPGAESFRAAWARAVEIAERRAAERIEAEHAATAGIKAPFRDNRRRAAGPSSQPFPTGGEGESVRERMPVICDRCGAEGVAGDEAFSGIPDILAFDPVPRRAHPSTGSGQAWDEPTQRAFIAALAVSGSPVRAARSVGRHAFGAEKLRKARGARSFNEAWEAALDLARERELVRLHGKLDELAKSPSPSMGEDTAFGSSGGRAAALYGEGDEPTEEQMEEVRDRCRMRLLNARRLYMREISIDPEKRKAWEVLTGPADWEKAELLKPQDNEPYQPNMRKPDMLLTCEAQWLAEMTGGPDKTKVLGEALEIEAGKAPSSSSPT